MKKLRRTTLQLWGALVLLAGATTPVFAAEELPRDHDLAPEAKELLERYRKDKSIPTLKYFDDLVKERNPRKLAEKEWTTDSKEVVEFLKRCYRDAEDKQKSKRGTPMNAAVKKWYEQEMANWLNIQKIGTELIDIHDDLVYYEHDLRNERLEELAEKKEKAEEAAGQITFWATSGLELLDKLKLIPIPNMDLVIEALKTLDAHGSKMNPVAAALEKAMVRDEFDVKALHKKLISSKYEDKVSRIVSQKIDTDQSGVFYKHERVWEENLTNQLGRYRDAYGKYKEISRPFLERWLYTEHLKPLKLSKSIGYDKLDESVAEFHKKQVEEVKKIQARVESSTK